MKLNFLFEFGDATTVASPQKLGYYHSYCSDVYSCPARVNFKNDVEAHLRNLKQEFNFPEFGDTKLSEWKMTRKLFRFNEDILPDDSQ